MKKWIVVLCVILGAPLVLAGGFSNPNFSNGLGGNSAVVQQVPGNCSDPNVDTWLSFDTLPPYTVPAGCASAGATFAINTAAGAAPSSISSDGVPNGLGSALNFDTSDDQYLLGNTTIWNLTSNQTMTGEIWLRAATPYSCVNCGSSFNGFEIPVSKGGNTAGGGWFFFLECNTTGVAGLELDGTGGSLDLLSAQSVCDNEWHRIRWTWNGPSQTATIAVDGNAATSSAPTFIGGMSNVRPAAIGIRDLGADRPFAGQIADLRITIGNVVNNLPVAFPVSPGGLGFQPALHGSLASYDDNALTSGAFTFAEGSWSGPAAVTVNSCYFTITVAGAGTGTCGEKITDITTAFACSASIVCNHAAGVVSVVCPIGNKGVILHAGDVWSLSENDGASSTTPKGNLVCNY